MNIAHIKSITVGVFVSAQLINDICSGFFFSSVHIGHNERHLLGLK